MAAVEMEAMTSETHVAMPFVWTWRTLFTILRRSVEGTAYLVKNWYADLDSDGANLAVEHWRLLESIETRSLEHRGWTD